MYFFITVDDYNKFTWIVLMKYKYEIAKSFAKRHCHDKNLTQ